MGKVAILGSYVVDLASLVDRLPIPGETLLGSRFMIGPGGKGSNQAIAAGRLGSEVFMIGRVGNDFFGQMAIDNFRREGINIDHVAIDPISETGTAQILVGQDSENMIVVVPGANSKVEIEHVNNARAVIQGTDIFLTQFELGMKTVEYGIETAFNLKKLVIVNPAPAQPLTREIFPLVSIMTPNETELQSLTNMPVDEIEQVEKAAKALRNLGVDQVVVTLGRKGALLVNESTVQHSVGLSVNAVDTTGAGDAFNGGLVTALAEGKHIKEAIVFANKVAALSVQRHGTAPSMPLRSEVESLDHISNK
ncbi:ribokinase [Lederbergia citrea]|uniref:Ribokinase n=1 Tax=Lederbergia citrea TaxID=2833581 RepID=A0A942UHU9_9BACI|nr:ribokinase [Lederbergia citrea]MBS4221740.1 ribokinase [Lederbergia citrea]